MLHSRRLGLERLEARWTPDAMPVTLPPTTPPTTVAPIDTTLAAQNSTSATVKVTVTAVGQLQTGNSLNVTLSGLTVANLQSGASLQFSYGGATYGVFTYWANIDGTFTFNLTNAAALANLTANTTATMIIGNGGNTPAQPTVPTAPPTNTLIIDTTLSTTHP
jgi:hypothetical protein